MILKENKGVSLTGFVITILVILLVISVAGCVYLYQNPRIQTESKIKKINDNKELVYTYASKSTDTYYSFEIPYVNIDSIYAKEINEKIQEKYPDVDKLLKDAINDVGELMKVSYQYFINNNILSLVISEFNGLTSNYYTYNIDIYTGEEVTNEMILKNKNISTDQFLNKVEELCTKAINEIYKDDEYGNKAECLSLTIKENKNMKIQMFLDENNIINIIPVIHNDIAQLYEIENVINTKL